MRTSLSSYLFSLLEDLSAELPEVTQKYMFGCDALFANGKIYALIWARDGRIAVKLPDPKHQEELKAIEGTEPWTPGQTMGNWWLVPETFHDEPERLRPWVERAHRAAFEAAGTGRVRRGKAATSVRAAVPRSKDGKVATRKTRPKKATRTDLLGKKTGR